MAVRLSTGVIADINNGAQPTDITFQILGVRKFPAGDRCRLLVSDGVYTSGFAILASQLIHMVTCGDVADNAIVLVKRYFCNEVSEKKKMMIILDMEVILSGEDAGGKIGDPQPYDKITKPSTNSSSQSSVAPAKTMSPAPAGNIGRSPLVQRNTGGGGGGGGSSSSAAMPAQAPTGMANVRPINTLTPYQNKWTICARVTSKSSIRTWSNARGDGKLFSMDLLDESGEIRATAFNAECEKFNDMIEVNNVYFISVATLKTANKQYTSLKNDYEMTFNAGTQMVPCHEDNSIPAMQFDFVALDQLEQAEKNSIIDLVGVCHEVADISTVTQKSTGRELKKRDIKVVDHTKRSVKLTLWGEQAEKFDGSGCPVLAIKGAKVSDFGGVSLSLIGSSTIQINPDISEAHQLKGWWEQTGCNSTDMVNLTSGMGGPGGGVGNSALKTLAEAKNEGLGSREQPDFYSCKAIVALVRKENILYKACPSDGCNKKVNDLTNGLYRCEKCNKEVDTFNWRLMMSCNLTDFTESQWVTMFQDNGETVLGTTAQEMGELKDENPDMFQSILSAASFKEYIFRLRVKMETYNDESRLKTVVQAIEVVNPVEYNKRLLKEIREMIG